MDKSTDVGDSATTGREKSPDQAIPGRVANKVPKFGTSGPDFNQHSETLSSLIRKARVSVRARSDAYMVRT